MSPIQVNLSFMKIRHNQDLPCFQVNAISYDVGESVVHAGLERCTTLDFIVRVIKLQDIRVMVEQLVLRNVTSFHSFELVISYLNNFVSVVDVAFDEVIKIRLQSPYDLTVLDHQMV